MKRSALLLILGLIIVNPLYGQEESITGIVKTYYSDGKIKEEVTYRDGKMNGKATKYYKDGTVFQEAIFKDGVPDGIGKIYDPNGRIKTEYLYQNGKTIGVRKYDGSGNIIEDSLAGIKKETKIPNVFEENEAEPTLIELKEDVKPKTKLSQISELKKKYSDGLTFGFLRDLRKKISKRPKGDSVDPAVLVIMLPMAFLLHILGCIPLYIIANKTCTPNGWLAYVPIANIFLLFIIAGMPLWWIFVCMAVALVNYLFGTIVILITTILVWMAIAEVRQKPRWIGILMVIPGVGFFVKWYLALSN